MVAREVPTTHGAPFPSNNKGLSGAGEEPLVERPTRLPDAILTVIISSLSDSWRLLHIGYSICRNLLVQCMCCWTRLLVGVRITEEVMRTITKVL
jgi:hypothetical protein